MTTSQRSRPGSTRTRTAASGALLCVLLLTACGGGSSGETGSAAAGSGAAPAATTLAAGTKLSANSASEAELMTIPGVGEKIAHEIVEYRPYDATTGPAKFREEMAKYVDDAEIDRLMTYLDFG